MHVEFEIHGCFRVPDGTTPVAGFRNLFRLPTGQVVSVQPVIEMASSAHDDDHQDLTFRQAESLGVALEVHDRQSELVDEEWPRHPDSCREVGEGRDPPSSIRLPDRTIPDQRL